MPPFSNVERLLFQKAAELFPGSPEDQARFVATAYHESGFNPAAHATQGEDSYGIFQFGKDLRRRYGLSTSPEPEKQIAAGGDYISELYRRHGGDWRQIAAEYNLGAPRYRRMLGGERDTAIDRFQSQYLPRFEEAYQKYAPREQSMSYASQPQPPLAQRVTPLPPLPAAPAPRREEPASGLDPNVMRALMLANIGQMLMRRR